MSTVPAPTSPPAPSAAPRGVRTRAARAGVRRGLTEFDRSLHTAGDIGYYVVGAVAFAAVLWANRNGVQEDFGVATGVFLLPGVLAMIVVFTAAYGLATGVATEREDGTLLRAKSMPNGMTGYVVGWITRVTCEVGFVAALMMLAATAFTDGVWRSPSVLPLVLLLLVLGLVASVPLGFVVGSVFKNPRSVGGWGSLVMFALIAVSGLFAPAAALPGYLQVVGQVFPMYWLGHGLRSVLLPESAGAAELGGEFVLGAAVGVLALWALLGLLLAPVLLRRMARRESGSAVSARRDKALQRV